MVDLGNLSSGLYRIIGGINSLLPFAKAIGGPLVGKVADLVSVGIEVATNIKERVEDGTVVARSNDIEEINDILKELQTINDGLNDYIVQS